MQPTFGLECALFFGVPGNKTELIDGKSRWAFPFQSRTEAEAHFIEWVETLRRWKQVTAAAPIRKADSTWQAEVAGIRMELFPRPIEIRIPIAWPVFRACVETHSRRDLWPGQPDLHDVQEQ